jgi:hypothetical protein
MPRARNTRRGDAPRSRQPPVERDPDIPHWLPAGDGWDKLPPNIREAVSRFIAPAYRRLVLEAPSEIP